MIEVAVEIARVVERDPAYAHTTSLVVVHGGELVLDRRFGAAFAGGLVDTYSMTKSVVATLAGIAAPTAARSTSPPSATC